MSPSDNLPNLLAMCMVCCPSSPMRMSTPKAGTMWVLFSAVFRVPGTEPEIQLVAVAFLFPLSPLRMLRSRRAHFVKESQDSPWPLDRSLQACSMELQNHAHLAAVPSGVLAHFPIPVLSAPLVGPSRASWMSSSSKCPTWRSMESSADSLYHPPLCTLSTPRQAASAIAIPINWLRCGQFLMSPISYRIPQHKTS